MIIIQKMMLTTLSVRVIDLTITIEMPKATAAPSTTSWPGFERSDAGAHDDQDADQAEHDRGQSCGRFSLSPRKATASIAVQIGVVNSIEISTASGIRVSA